MRRAEVYRSAARPPAPRRLTLQSSSGSFCEVPESAALEREGELRRGVVEDGVLVDPEGLAPAHQHPPVHDHGVHVGRVGEVRQARHRHVRRIEVRLAHVHQHDVGLLARLERAELIVETEGAGGADRRHLQHLARRHPGRIAEMTPVVVHALGHVPEHVVAAVGRRGVRADDYRDALADQLRRRTAPVDRTDCARVVHHVGAGVLERCDVLGREVHAVGEQREGPEQAELPGERDRSGGVAVLSEEDPVLGAQRGDGARHLAHLGRPIPHVTRVVDRQEQTDAGAPVQHVVPAPDQLRAHRELLAEPELDFFGGAVADAPVALREGAVVRPHRQDGAKAGLQRGFAVGVAEGGMVAAVDVVASPQQRQRGGDTRPSGAPAARAALRRARTPPSSVARRAPRRRGSTRHRRPPRASAPARARRASGSR